MRHKQTTHDNASTNSLGVRSIVLRNLHTCALIVYNKETRTQLAITHITSSAASLKFHTEKYNVYERRKLKLKLEHCSKKCLQGFEQ